ncbi:hypothetical protein IAT38_001870 [Cryptococcus sp. DSM 104549]
MFTPLFLLLALTSALAAPYPVDPRAPASSPSSAIIAIHVPQYTDINPTTTDSTSASPLHGPGTVGVQMFTGDEVVYEWTVFEGAVVDGEDEGKAVWKSQCTLTLGEGSKEGAAYSFALNPSTPNSLVSGDIASPASFSCGPPTCLQDGGCDGQL